jgi:acyl dehydratase
MSAVDRSKFIGYETPSFTADVEKGRLKFFAKAIGETDPIYSNETAAKAAGHPTIPVLPTFLFCLQMEQPNPYALYTTMGIRIEQILHGEQHFTYHKVAYAGDRLTLQMKIRDTYSKKGGTLGFIVRDTSIKNAKGELVAVLSGTTVVRETM